MLMLEQVRDWIISIDPSLADCIAVGGIDGNKDKCVGVYDNPRTSGKMRICVGGMACTRYQEKQVILLIHWTNRATEAENKAAQLYKKLCGLSHFQMGALSVVSVDPGYGPVSAGRDFHGVFEYVININIIYERDD